MELYISDHPLDCLTCSANGDCELQDMAGVVGLREVRYGYEGENHLDAAPDLSNPYFDFDPSKCIVCSRCVRACDEVQGTFALTIEGRGFDSKVSAGVGETFMAFRLRLLWRLRAGLPHGNAARTFSVVDLGMPTRSVLTTCAYCGVGCSFKAELRGDEVVRMVPYKDGGANEGHSCVKGRFAFGYATHPDRVMKPMMRETITDDWREVEWDEAISLRRSTDARDPRRARRRVLSAASPRRAAPTKRSTSSRRWCGRRSVTTTSTPARGCATPRPATASSRRSAPQPERRTSSRSTSPT